MRALEPWPVRLRTLDPLHLALVEFLRVHGQDVKLASYDGRVIDACSPMTDRRTAKPFCHNVLERSEHH
jgi:hypothetical protein